MRERTLCWVAVILAVFAAVAMPALADRNGDDDASCYFRGTSYAYRIIFQPEATLATLELIENYLDSVVKEATKAIQNADSHEEMLAIAERVERIVRPVHQMLEGMLGPGKVEASDITVCNEKVGACVTFDPIHLCGLK